MFNKELLNCTTEKLKGFFPLTITAKNTATVPNDVLGTLEILNSGCFMCGDCDCTGIGFEKHYISVDLITIACKFNDSNDVIDLSMNRYDATWTGKYYAFYQSLLDFPSYPKHGSIFIGYSKEKPQPSIPQANEFPQIGSSNCVIDD